MRDGRKLLSSTVVTVANYCRRGCLTRLIATTRVSFVRRVRCVRQGGYGVHGGIIISTWDSRRGPAQDIVHLNLCVSKSKITQKMILSDCQKFHLMGKIYSHGVKILFSWGKNLIFMG